MHKIRISYHIKSDHIKLYLYTYICYVYYVYTLKGSFLRGCPSKPLLPVWHRGPGELCGELVGVPRSGDQTWTRRWKILEGSIENGGFNELKSNISCNQLKMGYHSTISNQQFSLTTMRFTKNIEKIKGSSSFQWCFFMGWSSPSPSGASHGTGMSGSFFWIHLGSS